jgi:hypothetical protein
MADCDIANIDAHPELNAFLGVDTGISLGHNGLNLGRTLKGIDDTGELNKQAVSGGFDDPSAISGDGRVCDFGPDRP